VAAVGEARQHCTTVHQGATLNGGALLCNGRMKAVEVVTVIADGHA
jgi:hypothetical protein